ncbi:ParA family protein [Zoogloeaceae bacterium G21618-S1]|nr:ParA family protein [Zoogloeaceae bacterium G21618-S1]
MKTLVFSNQKGGVGKSILAYNMAHYFANRGLRVLFLDADQQANSSSSLVSHLNQDVHVADLFSSKAVSLQCESGSICALAPGALSAIERDPNDKALVDALSSHLRAVDDAFDVAVVDTPGSNSKAANAFLFTANYIVVPAIVDSYSMDVSINMLKRIKKVQQFNTTLVNLGLLPNLFDAVAPSQRDDLKKLLLHYKDYVLPAKISKRTAFRDAASTAESIWMIQKSSARLAAREMEKAFDLIRERMGVA